MIAKEDVTSVSVAGDVGPVTVDGDIYEIREGGRLVARVFIRLHLDPSQRPTLVAEVQDGVEVIRVKRHESSAA